MSDGQRKLAVLAGRGGLPAAVIEAATGSGRDVFVLGFEGETDPALMAGREHAWVKLGAVGKAIKLLHQAAAEDVVMIGAIERPSFAELKLDMRGMQLLAKLGLKVAKGDDQLLSIVVRELEDEGFRVVGADEIIRPMLAPEGLLTRTAPGDGARADIEVGVRAVRCIGELDIGQAVVVQDGRVLGVEAVEGTDALLARIRDLKARGPGGVLVKMKKPDQDRRADLPAVGARTVEGVIAAGLGGIAVHAGHCLLVDRPAMVAAADRAGCFIIGMRAAG
ncbi:MAG: UDP-2,3-diacylglucosamine diphosphatase LpxI [Alphaproteobacteria bacterium]